MCYDLRPPTQSLLHENLRWTMFYWHTRPSNLHQKAARGAYHVRGRMHRYMEKLLGTHAKREGRMKTTWRRRMVYYVAFIPAQQVINYTVIRLTSAISTSSAAAFVDFERSLRSKIARLQDK